MFAAEENAWKLIEKATEKYEAHFDSVFPIYEYTDLTSSGDYDFSVEGAKRLAVFIDKRIKNNDPVEVPKGYEDRVY